MLINAELKAVFLHAPKCAGMSFSQWLVDHYGFKPWGNLGDFCPRSPILERHRYVLPYDVDGFQVITTIRDPFQRWESCYIYYTLCLGSCLTFDQFTRDRIHCLPRQVEYTRHADYILRSDQLARDCRRLPFVTDPPPAMPRLNIARERAAYDQIKATVAWTDELRARVGDHFHQDVQMWSTMSELLAG